MATLFTVVNLYQVLRSFCKEVTVFFGKPFQSYQVTCSSLLDLICEYIFLIERLENDDLKSRQLIYKEIRNNTLYKRTFIKIYLLKSSFPVSLLYNDALFSSPDNLLIVFGWVLEQSSVILSLSKHVLQSRTGDLFLEDGDLEYDQATLFPNYQQVLSAEMEWIDILMLIRLEYSSIVSTLRELIRTIEESLRNEQHLNNICNSTTQGRSFDLGPLDCYFLLSRSHIYLKLNNQVNTISKLKELYPNMQLFWDKLVLILQDSQIELISPENIEVHLDGRIRNTLLTLNMERCFIHHVSSLQHNFFISCCKKSTIKTEKIQQHLENVKQQYEYGINSCNLLVSSFCCKFKSKTSELLFYFKIN